MISWFFENLGQICPKNNQCTNKECNLMHPRCFAGICINYFNENCLNAKCPENLQHLSKKEAKLRLNGSINGIFAVNLCPFENCKKIDQKCQYIHRIWVSQNKLCVKKLNDDCDDNKCKYQHQDWDKLRKSVQQKYEYKSCYPEMLDTDKHSQLFPKMCILFFQGLCNSRGKCPKGHIDWENISNVSADQIDQKKIFPCTRSQLPEEVKMEPKTWKSLEILFEKKKLQQFYQEIKERNKIDLLFIMDCSGSMRSWIEAAKGSIKLIVETFNKLVQQTTIRIAFIGYRDFCDKEKRIEYHDFTTEYNQIETFIGKLKATGGGDTAEDLTGALEKALTLNFSKHPLSILCTFYNM